MTGQKRASKYDERLPQIGRRLAIIRKQLGLNQEAMARFVGFSRRQWVSWEAGQISPSVWLLMELMEKLQIDPGWIIEGPGEAPLRRSGDRRLERLRSEVTKMASDLGLVIRDGLIEKSAELIFSQPVEQEREAKRAVREMLRELAIGKDDC